MGRILAMNPPFNGMSAVVNVLGRVGPRESNNPEDVRVIQQLLQMASRGSPIASRIEVPQATGRFDAATGFWIFYTQSIQRTGAIVDGVVSPARGAHYGPGGGIWTILIFNQYAKSNCPQEYAAFLAESTT